MIILRCKEHPGYEAKSEPEVQCRSCHRIWKIVVGYPELVEEGVKPAPLVIDAGNEQLKALNFAMKIIGGIPASSNRAKTSRRNNQS